MIASRWNIALPTLLLLLATSGAISAQSANASKPGVKNVQVSFASLKPSTTFKVGGTADWVLVTDDAVWVASTKPYSVQRFDPITNRIVAKVAIPSEACSGLAFGFGSVWVPICGKNPALIRVDAQKNKVIAILPIPPAGEEGGIATSTDSVWMVTDKAGTLNRIDPATNSVRQKISIPPGSYNPIFSDGVVWISGVESGVVTAVDADSGNVLDSIPVGAKPRFLTAGGGSIWTLNQGDGSVTRVDGKSRKVLARIQAGIPGAGGDIDYGANSVWLTVFDVPLTRVDAATNRVVKQWIGKGGDSLRFGFDSLWITDYKTGLLSRIPKSQLVSAPEKQQVSKQGTQNPEAYELYLKGRSYWEKRTLPDLETAVSYFNQAIAEDPGYALAYAGLADAYAILPDYGASPNEDIPKAKAAALKTLALDPTLARAHVNLGGIMMAHEWDFAGGEAEFKKALELDPNDTHAHERYADNLGVLGGREQEALAEINRAHQLDPNSLSITVEIGVVYNDARRFDEAIGVCKKVADENPTFAYAHSCLADAYWGKQMYPQIIEELKTYGQLSGERDDVEYASAMENGFRSGDWQAALTKGVEVLLAQRKTGYASPYTIATMYADLKDKEQAFWWLNTALQEHSEGVMGLKTDFLLDPLRSDPRFAELVRKVGLPPDAQQFSADETLWPTNGWATASPASVGVDEQGLLRLNQGMASGKYSQMWDSFAVFRCGKKIFESTYPHDYAKIYGKEAEERGSYNMRLTGRYNYFDPYWHPYYHGTDLHTMQSITKTITGVILGAAVQRGDFKASLDTPVLKYFDPTKVKNVDDRKRRITLRDLLNMATGFEWDAEGFENSGDPKNDTSQMEDSDDWVQYAIDKPMVAEPGKEFNYNDGAAVRAARLYLPKRDWLGHRRLRPEIFVCASGDAA